MLAGMNKRKGKQASKPLSWHLQLHFVVLTVSFLVVTLGFSTISMISMIGDSQNNGDSVFYIFSFLLAPFLALAFSYLLAPKQKSKLEQAFWVLVITASSMLLYTVVQQVWYILPFASTYMTADSWKLAEATRLSVSFIPVVAYFGYIYWLKEKRTR